MIRARAPLCALVAGLVLLLAGAPIAEAQRGGRGGRPGRPPVATPQQETPPGEYPLEFDAAVAAVGRGEGAQALAAYERTAAAAEQSGDRLLAARAAFVVAATAVRLGQFQKAIQSATHAIEVFKSLALAPPDQQRLASTYSQLGMAYRLAGDVPRARAVLEEGLAFAEKELAGRRESIAIGFLSDSLARTAAAQADYTTALARATQAARFFEDALGHLGRRAREPRRVNLQRHAANSLAAVGQIQLALGHPDDAADTLRHALDYARQGGLPIIEAEVLQTQGRVALARRDYSRAESLYRQALALATTMKQGVRLVWIDYGLAHALAGLGRTDDALAAAREAVHQVEELRAELGASDLRSGFLEDKQEIYHTAVHLAIAAKHPDEAFALAERGRSRAFLDLLGSQTALSKGRTRALVDEEVRLRARLAEAQARVQGAEEGEEPEEGDGSPGPRAALEAAERDYRAFLERVRKENLEQASLMTVEPVTLPEIQALLPAGTTLLEYLVSEHDVTVWVVDRDRTTLASIPGERAALLTEVRRFRHAIATQAPAEEVQAHAQALYARLLGPVRASIHTERLLVVPHGVLHYVPFAALRSPAGRWVVEDFAIGTLPSASVLRYLAGKGAAAPVSALVVGNPDLGSGLALRWAEREARMVAAREAGSTLLTRDAATEAEVKKRIEGVGVVHLATHGVLSESDPLSSALLFVPGAGEDGRLEVREVFGLDLHARLVVLSACETGLGKLSRGDELVGLQRAFLYAGAPDVVTTLWRVDDRASYQLVRAFYERLERLGPLEALRQAQLETLRATPHPFAWAGFGLTGVPR